MDPLRAEQDRLLALEALEVLDSASQPIFDTLTDLAVRTFGVSAAAISLVDKDRQWFKACVGLPVRETPRDIAFCDHTIRNDEALVVLDAAADPRFAHNPLVTGDPGIRFYAGAPLTTPEGFRVGTFCLIDVAPRAEFPPEQIEQLRRIADAVMQGLVMRVQALDSARKTAEAEQKAAEALEKAALLQLSERLAHVGYWTWNPESNRTVWSPEIYRIHALDPSGPAPALDELLALYHPDDAAQLAACVERAVTLGEPYDLEARIIRPDGEIRNVITCAGVLRDGSGRVSMLHGSFQDITERQLAHAKLRASEERYRLLADNATDLILTYDLNGRVTYASPSLARYGYRPDDLIGRTFGGLTHPEDVSRARQPLMDALAGKSAPLEAFRARCTDGTWAWFEGRMSPLNDASGRQVGVLGVSRDVTARLAAEQALSEVNAELTRVARISALGAFSASIAHEINQPLAAIAINSETAFRWMSEDPPNVPKAQAAIKRSLENALRASDTIARIRSMVTKRVDRVSEFDINDAIREVFALTSTERQRSKVTTTADTTPHPLMIRSDRIQVQQVLLNLIGNAMEAMLEIPEADRKLWVRSRMTDNGHVLVEVEDRGPGLDPTTKEKIFDHLFSTKTGGTGLGLSISKAIIESDGGRIWAEPAKPSGAMFRFQLPHADGIEARRHG